ncbi:MAG: transketolase [Desulfobacterales bacterium]|nr:transketolase [Desulfobacterales bacterium]MDD4071707.1 transketolase [Desulfobacterales bacterium]MDD4391389.1 transketolase [Desulfobacterales bacterium]
MTTGLSESQSSIENLCVNTIRTLAMDAVQKANSGHPGAPMGLATAAYVLWTRMLKHNPENPQWQDRDRFVLSGGHASMLLYSLLFLTGYDVSLDDIKQFRQWGSKTPGHPEYGHTPGVETTTGPLGQGFSNAVGMAIAERHLAARFNRPGLEIVNHFTYMMCGDGDMMEGISSESASLAGHLGLGRLVCIYDDNQISIEGSTSIAFTEDVCLRFKAYHWHVQIVEDGNDTDAIYQALQAAKAETAKPSIIILKTHIAFGSPHKQDTAGAHGAPLGAEEIRLTKRNLGWPEDESFLVPQQALDAYRQSVETGRAAESTWKQLFDAYSKACPDLAQAFADAIAGIPASGWEESLPLFSASDAPIATRAVSGKIINAIADRVPSLIGGSADLAPSNNTLIKSSHDLQKNSYDGRNIRFGVREHAMGGILSGMALHKGIKPFGGTFLVFADYMRPSIRLAALMKLPVTYVFTHDSIAVGEDGPTHQPVEHVAVLRAIPGLTVIRPADAAETVQAWRIAIASTDSPTALILTRQNLPVIDRSIYAAAEGLKNGAYILSDAISRPDIILIATGSEVTLAMSAADRLAEQNIAVRVVSMPSRELFEKMPASYRQEVLPPDVTKRISIEAGITTGWERYVGTGGDMIGIDTFGASAPGAVMMEKYGFTEDNIVQKALSLLKK